MKHLLLCMALTGCTISIHIDEDSLALPAELPDKWIKQRAETFVNTPDPAGQLQRIAKSGWYVTGRKHTAGYEQLILEREYNPFRNQHRPVQAEAQ
jgi:hypothetical protein